MLSPWMIGMRHNILAFVGAILLTGALSACVSTKQHEELKTLNSELRQDLRDQELLLFNTRKDHRTVVMRLEADKSHLQQQLSGTQTQLKLKQEDLKELRQKHEITSAELSKTAANSLDLIEEKKQLNASVIELQGTISTLRDTVKDLQGRVAEAATAAKAQSNDHKPISGDQPSKVPQ